MSKRKKKKSGRKRFSSFPIEKFGKTWYFTGLVVPNKLIQVTISEFKNYFQNIRGVRPVQSLPNESPKSKTHKLILVKLTDEELAEKSSFFDSHNNEITILPEKRGVKVGYDDMSFTEAIKQIVPLGIDPIHSYEQVGHIAHLNLKDEHEPYKKTIGEIILDKNYPTISVVIAKVGIIENIFRVLPFEILVNADDYNDDNEEEGEMDDEESDLKKKKKDNLFFVDIKEYGIRFQFDYSKVYWNSRLAREHQRIRKVCENGIVFDMFGGVGPFAVPLAYDRKMKLKLEQKKIEQLKRMSIVGGGGGGGIVPPPPPFDLLPTVKKKLEIYANDLNPQSYKYLVHNCKLNSILPFVECFNMDGRKMIPYLVKERKIYPDHVLMNLPGSAIEFLDVFQSLLGEDEKELCSPTIHCYTFEFEKEGEEDPILKIKRRINRVLGLLSPDGDDDEDDKEKEGEILIEYLNFHEVRSVSSYKKMFCVSMKFSPLILCRKKRNRKVIVSDDGDEDEEKRPSKKQKI